MAMETESVRSDVQNSLDRIKEVIRQLLRLFQQKVLDPAFRWLGIKTKNKIGSSINDRRNQKKLVDKAGITKEKIQLDKLSYDEVALVSNMAINEKVPIYIVADNGREYISINQIKKMTSVINELNVAKSNFVADTNAHEEYENAVTEAKKNAVTETRLNDAYEKALEVKRSASNEADKTNVVLTDKEKYAIREKLLDDAVKKVRANNEHTIKIDRLEKEYQQQLTNLDNGFDENKYNILVQQIKDEYYLNNPLKAEYELTETEKQECYDKACSGVPIRYTVVMNKSCENFKQRAENSVVQMRAERGIDEVDERVGINKDTSEIIHRETTNYERVVDEDKYNQLLENALKNNDNKASQEEVEKVCRESATYGTNENTFYQQVVSKESNGGYSIMSYNEEEGKAICDKMENNYDFPNHRWCAYSTYNENNEKKIHICVLDDDYDKYSQLYNVKVDTKHISKNTVKNPSKNSSSTNKAMLSNNSNNKIDNTYNVESWVASVRESKEDENYELKYDKDGNVEFAQIEVKSVNEIKGRIAQFQSAESLAKEQNRIIDEYNKSNIVNVFASNSNYKSIKRELKSLYDENGNPRAKALYNAFADFENTKGRQPNENEINIMKQQFLNNDLKKAQDMYNESLDNDDIENNRYIGVDDKTDFSDDAIDVNLDIADE